MQNAIKILEKTKKELLGYLVKAIKRFHLIVPKDKILIAVSGGKDSLVLTQVLWWYKQYFMPTLNLFPVLIELDETSNTDYFQLKNWFKTLNLNLTIIKTSIRQIVFTQRQEKNPCSLCSKLRKGTLYDYALQIGANKVALGHHINDLTNTFLLSLIQEGRLKILAPEINLSRTKLTVVRPLILTPENLIIKYAASAQLPVIKNNCSVNKKTERQKIDTFFKNLSVKTQENIISALLHPERNELLKNK